MNLSCCPSLLPAAYHQYQKRSCISLIGILLNYTVSNCYSSAVYLHVLLIVSLVINFCLVMNDLVKYLFISVANVIKTHEIRNAAFKHMRQRSLECSCVVCSFVHYFAYFLTQLKLSHEDRRTKGKCAHLLTNSFYVQAGILTFFHLMSFRCYQYFFQFIVALYSNIFLS